MRKKKNQRIAHYKLVNTKAIFDWNIKYRNIALYYDWQIRDFRLTEYKDKFTDRWELERYWETIPMNKSLFKSSVAYWQPIIEIVDWTEYRPITVTVKKNARSEKVLYIEHTPLYKERREKTLST